ncbi:MAG TPA: glycosyltransferase family 4 protein, partial [Chloroflexota bacterium]|nr:glycosyltransferase family 4 protein [Chloroflexota bacterium]
MRTLLLATSFSPAVGGMETLLYQTVRRLEEPPLVLTPRATAAPRDVEVRGVPTTLFERAAYRPLWRLHPSLYYFAAWLPTAVRAARHWRPQAVQVGHVYLAPLGQLLARRLRVPLLVYVYGQEVWRGGAPMGLPRLDAHLRGRALRNADAVLSPGSFTSGLLDEWGVSRERVVCVPYGAEPRPPSAPPSGTTVLSVARLVPRKGVDTIIRALPRLPGVQYRVVGSGHEQARLRRLAMAKGVDRRVTFAGRVDDARLAEEYQRCALFALPARRTADGELEGYGLVYFEAAAWGRPVVAGRSGGEVDAVVDGETGLL